VCAECAVCAKCAKNARAQKALAWADTKMRVCAFGAHAHLAHTFGAHAHFWRIFGAHAHSTQKCACAPKAHTRIPVSVRRNARCAKMRQKCAFGAHGGISVCAKCVRQLRRVRQNAPKCAFGAHGEISACAKMRQRRTGPVCAECAVCAKCAKNASSQKALPGLDQQ
jgi:hypothetical protein